MILAARTALGGEGGSLGYGQSSSIVNSVALEGNIYGGNTIGIGLGVNGSTGPTPGTGAVDAHVTNTPVNVTLSYSDSTKTLTARNSCRDRTAIRTRTPTVVCRPTWPVCAS